MFEHCLYFNSTALARVVEREWAAAYGALGLTPSQGFVLRVIFKRPGCLGSDVAQTLDIARSTATRLVDALCEKGLVDRVQATSDKREWSLHASKAGKALEKPIYDASVLVSNKLRARLSTELFDQTVDCMRDVRVNLG